jgi:MFS family permease
MQREPRDAGAWLSPAKGWYLTIVMFLIYVSGQIDRQIMAMLVEPMKRDLHFTDAQMGVLLGLGFSLAYALTTPVAALLGDRMGRKKILGFGLGLWSVLTMLCAFTRTFPLLLLARLGVGVGEAALAPSAMPMIANAFPPERRSFPIALCVAGSPVGLVITPLLLGFVLHALEGVRYDDVPLIGSFYGWQASFFLAGLLGFVLLFLLLPFVEQPHNAAGGRDAPSIPEAMGHFVRNPRFYAAAFLAMPIFTIGHYAIIAWMPAFLERRFDLGVREIGMLTGLGYVPGAILGPLIGGAIGTWAQRSGLRRPHFTVMAWMVPLGATVFAVPMLLPSAELAMMAYAIAVTASTIIMLYAMIGVQQVLPERYRGQGTAVLAATLSLVGSGIGPALVGLLTTHVVGEQALDRAMTIALCLSAPFSFLLLLLAVFDPARHPNEQAAAAGPRVAGLDPAG